MERPTNFSEKRIDHLRMRKTQLLAQIAEIDMEIQRIDNGNKPKGIEPCRGCPHCKADFSIRPLSSKIDKPPYEHLLQ